MLMVGLRQSFPAPGSLPARRLVATNDAEIADSDLRTRELDLAAQVKQAFAEYTRADAEARIHREHVDLTNHLIEVARVQYASNRLGQEDVLRTSVEAARLHSDLIAVEQERRSAAALLNVLMGRAPEAPLGKPKAVSTTATLAQVAAVKTERPEIVAASGAVARSAAALDATRAEAKWPMFMVGLDYVYDPMLTRSGYTAMVGMTLPWLNGGRKAEVRAAEAELTAQQQALEAVKLTTQYQLADAAARVKAAQQALSVLDESVLPQMKRGFEASRASFASGGGSALGVIDSLRSLLQIQVDRTRAVARLAASIAAFERAAGTTTPTLDPSRT
jgi:outer membrane protein TolC